MTRKKEAVEDRMERANGGKEKKPLSSMLYTSHTSGPGNKDLSLSPFLCPPLILPNFLFSQEERETECFSRLTEGGRAAKLCTCSYFLVRVDALLSSDTSVCNNSNTIMLLHRLIYLRSWLCHHEQPHRRAHHPVMKTQTSPAA